MDTKNMLVLIGRLVADPELRYQRVGRHLPVGRQGGRSAQAANLNERSLFPELRAVRAGAVGILGYSSFFSALEWAAILDDDWSLLDDDEDQTVNPIPITRRVGNQQFS